MSYSSRWTCNGQTGTGYGLGMGWAWAGQGLTRGGGHVGYQWERPGCGCGMSYMQGCSSLGQDGDQRQRVRLVWSARGSSLCALHEWIPSAGLLGCCCPCCVASEIVNRLEENCCGCAGMANMRTKLRLLTGIRVSHFLSSKLWGQ